MGLPNASDDRLIATASRADFAPMPPPSNDIAIHDFSPAVTALGGSFAIFGNNLDDPAVQKLYLIDNDGREHDVTTWRASSADDTPSRLVVTLPSVMGALPNGAPEPGVYLLRAGDAETYRCNAVTVIVTARFDQVPAPWTPVDGIFNVSGAGFVPGSIELLLDTVSLTSDRIRRASCRRPVRPRCHRHEH